MEHRTSAFFGGWCSTVPEICSRLRPLALPRLCHSKAEVSFTGKEAKKSRLSACSMGQAQSCADGVEGAEGQFGEASADHLRDSFDCCNFQRRDWVAAPVSARCLPPCTPSSASCDTAL